MNVRWAQIVESLRLSRVANAAIIVTACVVFMALMGPKPQYAGVYDYALTATTSRAKGVLEFSDLRHRYMRIRTDQKAIVIQCDVFTRSIGCYPKGGDLPKVVTVEYITFRGRNILMSVADDHGEKILTRDHQLVRLRGNVTAIKKLDLNHYVVTGLIWGLVFAALRDLYLRREAKRKIGESYVGR